MFLRIFKVFLKELRPRKAGEEETDHLICCKKRLEDLNGRPSILNPLWYAGSFTIGAIFGSFGKKTSLGFVEETEKQVVKHLEKHLDKVSKKGVFFRGAEPFQDSRVIINSENILEITIALYEFLQHNGEVIVPKKNVEVKSVVISGPIKLTEEEKIKNYCMKLLKEKLYAPNNL